MKALSIALPVVSLFASTLLASPINLNSPVTLNGSFPSYTSPVGPGLCGTTPPQASASTLDDGVFLPENTCYQSGTVYWNSQNPLNTIDIDLQGTFLINGAIVQADDNDIYELQYRDIGGVYHNWYDVPTLGSFGMVTRPGSPDQTLIHALPAVQATGLRFFAPVGSGDGEWSVSEIQVFAVPEPSTTWLVFGGLALLFTGVIKRRHV
jgi:hypothetical protein